MASGARTQSDRGRAAARELARTPISDPYRGQLHDPFTDKAPPDDTDPAPLDNSGPYPTGLREGAPQAAVAAGILSIVLGCFAALSGFVLIAAITLENSLGAPDRSFYQGADAAHVVLGLLDFALAGAGALGGIALMTGRLAGRLFVTAFGWIMLGESAYWLTGSAPAAVPLVVGTVSAAALWLAYHGSVTRWLGVLPPPQPE